MVSRCGIWSLPKDMNDLGKVDTLKFMTRKSGSYLITGVAVNIRMVLISSTNKRRLLIQMEKCNFLSPGNTELYKYR